MTQPIPLTAEQLEILVARELRKSGLEVERLRRGRSGGADGLRVYMTALVGTGADAGAALIRCEVADAEVTPSLVDEVLRTARELAVRHAFLFATAEWTPAAAERARSAGVSGLRILRGRDAFDSGGWGPRGQYPVWLPEWVALAVVPGEPVRYVPAETAATLLRELATGEDD